MLGERRPERWREDVRRLNRDRVAVAERERDAEAFERLEEFPQRHRIISRAGRSQRDEFRRLPTGRRTAQPSVGRCVNRPLRFLSRGSRGQRTSRQSGYTSALRSQGMPALGTAVGPTRPGPTRVVSSPLANSDFNYGGDLSLNHYTRNPQSCTSAPFLSW